jgi:hypothetical protein
MAAFFQNNQAETLAAYDALRQEAREPRQE